MEKHELTRESQVISCWEDAALHLSTSVAGEMKVSKPGKMQTTNLQKYLFSDYKCEKQHFLLAGQRRKQQG